VRLIDGLQVQRLIDLSLARPAGGNFQKAVCKNRESAARVTHMGGSLTPALVFY